MLEVSEHPRGVNVEMLTAAQSTCVGQHSQGLQALATHERKCAFEWLQSIATDTKSRNEHS
jgi:hypothetical protein